jgi:hypothetical protein
LIGFAMIDESIRVLELPMLFESAEEVVMSLAVPTRSKLGAYAQMFADP